MSDYHTPAEAETEAFPAVSPRRRPWRRISVGPVAMAAVAAGLIVAIGAGVVLAAGQLHRPAAVRASPTPSEQPLPEFAGKRSPVLARVIDRRAGLSYDRLGGGWTEGKDGRRLAQALGSPEQPVMTAGGAEYLVAPLQAGLGSSADQVMAANVAEEVIRSARYPAKPMLTPYSPEWLPGGWMAGFQVGSSQGDWEVVVAAVFDTGVGRPGVLVVTVPKARRSLLPDIRALAESVQPQIKPVGRAGRM